MSAPTIARVIAALLVTTLVTCAVLLEVVYPTSKGPGTGKVVTFVVTKDQGAFARSQQLAELGLVSSPRIFALFMLSHGGASTPVPGPHFVTDDLEPGELLKRLQRFGLGARVKVTIPEGFTRFDIARRLEEKRVCSAASFLEASVRPELLTELGLTGSAEGFLFPATYEFAADADPDHVIRRMKSEFDRRLAQLHLAHSLSKSSLSAQLGWGTRELVVLASMVEKEAVVDDERPLIAAVFMNRLRDPAFKRKVLQCDPTAGYGCLVLGAAVPACAGYAGKITHDINSAPENTYSTYTHEGLPPGPISNPGAKSLEAAVSPANTKHLYFVARGGGRHAFSETFDDHHAAVKASGATIWTQGLFHR
ncbi:MAG TPA: endolytic transglycosylase MltG, partial [Polyangiaceae bacterium]|nr:endolytic transglycosylase MltG [Polyangiaceae bacterium]